MRRDSGFTLLELLVVMTMIGILSYLGLTSFYVYKSDAAYSVAESVLRNARVAVEASLNDIDNPPAAVDLVQTASGKITNQSASQYLPGMQLPKNIKITVVYDPSCAEAGCQSDFLEVRHCLGKEYLQWVRFGDGTEAQLNHLAGVGC